MKCYAYNNAAKRRLDRRQVLTDAYNQANGVNPEEVKSVRPVLTIKRTAMNRVDKALSVQATPVYDSLDNRCLHNTWLYSVR
ncbi:hypothetical protein B5C26_00775 [Photorhabdus luminescens]|uniref:hypothetical protein n=1 Tax=Photorhabdus luminescens TaxID=29488 RepID=UPI000B4CF416|nr:hypothetical protein [Photorhabdus luminescens]OWO86984.1 hypothetical protein B5C26_00775 [Photorhabdus luminescens]